MQQLTNCDRHNPAAWTPLSQLAFVAGDLRQNETCNLLVSAAEPYVGSVKQCSLVI